MNELMMPALRPSSLGLRGNGVYRHVGDGRSVLVFRSGRLALAAALACAGVGARDEVLVPAYHCQSIVDPILAVGAKPVFYRLLPDLNADIRDIRRKLKPTSRSVIAVHFFGVFADLPGVRALCDEQGLILIEDCAHCFSFSKGVPAYGRTGNYVVTSPRKFIPVYDGGELYSPSDSLAVTRHFSPDPRYELKIAINILQRGLRRRRLGREALVDAAVVPSDRDGANQLDATGAITRDDPDYVDPRFDLSCGRHASSIASRGLTRMMSLSRVERRRVSNFNRLAEASRSWRQGEQAFADLDHAATPYVFPLRLAGDGDRLYARLKQAGVPMWRWDDLCQSDCCVSADYRASIVQLPCHQELTESFLTRMICALNSVLG